jgi:ion channel
MMNSKINLTVKTLLRQLLNYLKEYKLIYIGVVLCNFCCFSFHNVFNDRKDNETVFVFLITLFFLMSFVFPIILGLIFTAKCFVAKTRKQLLSNIIHSYFGTVLIFAALYYQCSVLGDFNDAVNKRISYESQVNLKKNNCPDLTIMRVADRRAFKGIKPRIWSGYDYPSSNITIGPNVNPDSWHYFLNNNYEDLSVEQIERIVNNKFEGARVIEYQKENVEDVYIDCLYFSVVCIATVGFGDIAPNLWFTKLFTALEVFIGLSIFVFAIGMLFSNWTIKEQNKSTS